MRSAAAATAATLKTSSKQRTLDVVPQVAALLGATSPGVKLLQGCSDGGEELPTACASNPALRQMFVC